MNKVSALSVLSNAVLVWNTVRIAAIVKELETSSRAHLASAQRAAPRQRPIPLRVSCAPSQGEPGPRHECWVRAYWIRSLFPRYGSCKGRTGF